MKKNRMNRREYQSNEGIYMVFVGLLQMLLTIMISECIILNLESVFLHGGTKIGHLY